MPGSGLDAGDVCDSSRDSWASMNCSSPSYQPSPSESNTSFDSDSDHEPFLTTASTAEQVTLKRKSGDKNRDVTNKGHGRKSRKIAPSSDTRTRGPHARRLPVSSTPISTPLPSLQQSRRKDKGQQNEGIRSRLFSSGLSRSQIPRLSSIPDEHDVHVHQDKGPSTSTGACSSSSVHTQNSFEQGILAQLSYLKNKIDRIEQKQTEGFSSIENTLQKMTGFRRQGSTSSQLEVPAHVRAAVHDGYKSGVDEMQLEWVTKDGDNVLKSSSEVNKGMTDHITSFVKGLYPSIEAGIIKAGIDRYFESVKQRKQKEISGKTELHKKKMLNYSRRQRKLAWRKEACGKKTGWDEHKKTKVLASLQVQFMSSEEEIDSEDEVFFRVKPLPWRSQEFNNICKELDQKYEKSKSNRSKRQMTKRVTGQVPSSRKKPIVEENNEWVVMLD